MSEAALSKSHLLPASESGEPQPPQARGKARGGSALPRRFVITLFMLSLAEPALSGLKQPLDVQPSQDLPWEAVSLGGGAVEGTL